MTVELMPRAYAKAKEIAPEQIPLIDFGPFLEGSASGKAKVAGQIGEACREVGFLYLVNHGVPQATGRRGLRRQCPVLRPELRGADADRGHARALARLRAVQARG